jgi:hypothetical protein
MEATYRIKNTPAVANQHIGGTWWAFWQGGEGCCPTGTRGNTVEVDHPEIHGEWPELLDWGILDWYTNGVGNIGFPANGDFYSGLDNTAYHTFGVRSITDGSTGISYCSYVDGIQRACNSTTLNSAQYAEKKFPILFVGLQCYYFPSVSNNCINVPISSIYNCNGKFCVHASSAVTEQNFWPVWMNITGVTGASNINGSWQATSINWNNGATDWVLTGSSFNGAPTGGMINAVTAVDLLIQNVHVWTAGSAPSGPNQLGATWTTTGASQQPTTAPDGVTPAILMTEASSTSESHGLTQNGPFTTAESTLTANIAPGTSGSANVMLYATDSTYANQLGVSFNPSTGQVVGPTFGPVTGFGATPITGGGYKVYITFNMGSVVPQQIALLLANSSGSAYIPGDGTSNAKVWGAQLKTGIAP